MTKLQARMKDQAAKAWRERKLYYKVGSIFKGCAHCSSQSVYRAFAPIGMGWAYKCWDCSATDEVCWPVKDPNYKQGPRMGNTSRKRFLNREDHDRFEYLREKRREEKKARKKSARVRPTGQPSSPSGNSDRGAAARKAWETRRNRSK